MLVVVVTLLLIYNMSVASHPHYQTCTRTTSDTCYIERSTTWDNSVEGIECDDNYPICIVICDGLDASCSSLMSIPIKCPSNGDKCLIYCTSV